MSNQVLDLIDEAIKLELNMSNLYSIFNEYIQEDKAFWYRISIEEKNHAALLKTAKDFIRFNKFPRGLLPENLDVLKESNKKVKDMIDRFILNPDRILAFEMAIEIEKSAGEIHFQLFMEKKVNNNINDIFQRLNQADKDHAQRIEKYWHEVLPDNSGSEV